MDGIAPSTKYGDLITADHKILNVEHESTCGHENAPTFKRISRIGFQIHPMKTEETSETMSCLQRVLPPSQKHERIYTENSKEFMRACQDLQ